MPTMYYSRETRQFLRSPGPDTIATPGPVHAQLLEDQRSGKEIAREEDGTPNDVAALLTLNGMRAAVLREVRAERALILNALTGVGYDALRAGNATLLAQVDAARAFLRDITKDVDVLAVTPENGGWEVMREVVLTKWKAYAYDAPPAIRNAFAEIA
jgi:hypothetical protein